MKQESIKLLQVLDGYDESISWIEAAAHAAKVLDRGTAGGESETDVQAARDFILRAESYAANARRVSPRIRELELQIGEQAVEASVGTTLAERLHISRILGEEHQQGYDNVQRALAEEADFGFKFLALQTTIFGLAIPAASFAGLASPERLAAAAIWMAWSIGAKVVQLRVGKYLATAVLQRRGEYMSKASKAIGRSEVVGFPAAFSEIAEESESMSNWLSRYTWWTAPLALVSEILVYGAFVKAMIELVR